MEPVTRGDPMSPLRWTTKSTRHLADALTRDGHPVSHCRVGELLRGLGYSLQSNLKAVEGKQHPDRDGQFAHINALAKRYLKAGDPVISIDAKKKELVGESPGYKNGGRDCSPKANRSGSGPMTSRTPTSPRPSPTASTTWPPTPGGSPSAVTVTPGRSRWPPCAAGGPRSASPPTRTRNG